MLGVTALLVPLPVPRGILRREGPWFLGSAALALALFWDTRMTLLESLGLLAVLGAFAFPSSGAGTTWMQRSRRASPIIAAPAPSPG